MKTIFVSSTFKDMHYERDAIQEIAQPLLNEEARKFGQHVSFCDLRWGINTGDLDSEEGSKKILDVCLDEIDRCKPPMVVILGDRYGWIPSGQLISTAAERKKIQLDDLQKSVTALEIEYGALSDSSKAEGTLFYFRVIENLAPEDYDTEDEEHAKKLKALKDKIIKLTDGKIKTYKVSWNGNGFDGIKEFAHMLANDLKALLKPEWEAYASPTPFEKEMNTQWSFIREKSEMFRARQSFADKHIESIINGKELTIIKGNSGSGKSTLFSNIAFRLKEQGVNVLPFISGLTSSSNDAMDITQNIAYYLEQELSLPHFSDETGQNGEMIKHTADEWTKYLAELCAQYSALGRNVVIMLDAADQLFADENRDRLIFIPQNLSKNVQFVMTCIDGFKTPGREFSKLKPLDESDKKEVIYGTLNALGRELEEKVIDEMVKLEASDNPLFLSLLLQRLMMMNREDFNEITKLGDGMQAISKHQIDVIRSCPSSLSKMCVALLNEAGRRINSELVSKSAEYISISRHGLRSDDLAALLGDSWSALDFTHFVSYMSDSFILRYDGRYDFSHKSIREGFKKLYSDEKQLHKEILQHFKSLDENDEVRVSEITYHCIMADDKEYFAEYICNYEYHKNKAYILFASKATYECCLADEGKWLCTLLEDGENFGADEKIINFVNFDLFECFEQSLREMNILHPILKCNMLLSEKINDRIQTADSRRDLSISYNQVAGIYEALDGRENLEKALELYKKNLKISEQLVSELNTADSRRDLSVGYGKVAEIFEALGGRENLKKALELYKKSLKIFEQLVSELNTAVSRRDLSFSYNKVAGIYKALDGRENLEKAIELYKKSLKIFEQLVSELNTAESRRDLSVGYSKVAEIFEALGGRENHKKALELYKNGLKIFEQLVSELNTAESRRDLSISYNKVAGIYKALGGRENLEKALELYKKSLKIFEQLVSELNTAVSRSDLSFSYNNVAGIYEALGGRENLEKALELYKNGLKISEQLANTLKTVDAFDNLAVSLYKVAINQLTVSAEKKKLLERSLSIAEKLYEVTQSERHKMFVDVFKKTLKEL